MAPTEPWESTAGHLIRLARRRARLSQGDLARASGIGQPMISRYESGQVQPTLPALQRLIRATGGALRIELDGLHAVDHTRAPTERENLGMDAAFLQMLDRQPAALRRSQDAARRRWMSKLRGVVLTDRPVIQHGD